MITTLISKAERAVTGWDFTSEEAKTVGLRAVKLVKVFNIRYGIQNKYDSPSECYDSPLVDGSSKEITIM